VIFSQNEPITTFWSTQNDPSCHKTRFLGSKYHKNSVAAGTLSRTPLGKLTWEPLCRRRREGSEKERECRKNEKGLQCPEFLTWKVGNRRYAADSNLSDSKGHATLPNIV